MYYLEKKQSVNKNKVMWWKVNIQNDKMVRKKKFVTSVAHAQLKARPV